MNLENLERDFDDEIIDMQDDELQKIRTVYEKQTKVAYPENSRSGILNRIKKIADMLHDEPASIKLMSSRPDKPDKPDKIDNDRHAVTDKEDIQPINLNTLSIADFTKHGLEDSRLVEHMRKARLQQELELEQIIRQRTQKVESESQDVQRSYNEMSARIDLLKAWSDKFFAIFQDPQGRLTPYEQELNKAITELSKFFTLNRREHGILISKILLLKFDE